jgi:predicted DNA-binding transcriptional regulator YafY
MQRVIERLLNLLAFLLTASRPVTADEIRQTVAGYGQEGDEAFRRTFERDKDLLRRLGIPLTMKATDVWEVEHGYLIPNADYALQDPGLTDEELAALGLATQVVRLGGQAPGPAALFKLGGALGLDAGEPLAADLGESGESLPMLFTAVAECRAVAFDYKETRRRVHAYGLAHRRGHWYLVGPQNGKGEARAFRVDRMDALALGRVSPAFTRPPGFHAADAIPDAPWEAGPEDVMVEVAFDSAIAWWARRQLTPAAEIRDGSDGGFVARFPVANVAAFIAWMIGFEERAEVLKPEAVRSRLIAHLESA